MQEGGLWDKLFPQCEFPSLDKHTCVVLQARGGMGWGMMNDLIQELLIQVFPLSPTILCRLNMYKSNTKNLS